MVGKKLKRNYLGLCNYGIFVYPIQREGERWRNITIISCIFFPWLLITIFVLYFSNYLTPIFKHIITGILFHISKQKHWNLEKLKISWCQYVGENVKVEKIQRFWGVKEGLVWQGRSEFAAVHFIHFNFISLSHYYYFRIQS